MPRTVAPRTERRRATIELGGDYAGWTADVYLDFRAGVLVELQSGDLARVIGVIDELVIDHNFPSAATGELATSMRDVDFDAILALADATFSRIRALPNRSGRP